MSKMEIRYGLSKKGLTDIFVNTGERPRYIQLLEVECEKLTKETRQNIAVLGNSRELRLDVKHYDVEGGWDKDGVMLSYPPSVTTKDWEFDDYLTPEQVPAVITTMVAEKKACEEKVAALLPKWEAEYAKKVDEEKEKERQQEERRRKRYSKGWIKAVTDGITVTSTAKAEIERFCKKFEFDEWEVQTMPDDNTPFVLAGASIPLEFGGHDFTIRFRNRREPSVIGEPFDYQDDDEGFSELDMMVAEALARVFNGTVGTIQDYDEGMIRLVVRSEGDTIFVATRCMVTDC